VAEMTLGHFLRRRRALLDPESSELTTATRRRVPGLRREEVARRVGVSTNYYTRLEQGRRIAPSESVLNALADVLRLDQPARDHMRDLAWNNPREARQPSQVQQVRLGMLRLMEAFGGTPAVLLGRRTDIIAANPTARLLFADFHAMAARERNGLRWVLFSEEARQLFLDWGVTLAGLVGMFRMDAGRHPNDPRTADLIDEFSEQSRHFAKLWNDCHVATSVVRETKVVEHPVVGRIRFHVEAVTTPQDPDQVLQVFMPESDSASQSAVRDLQTLADTRRRAPGDGSGTRCTVLPG
jgi:transcriptional regulator with XRE-family HTH domain